jgi:prevent-host-death family protein
MGTVGLRELRQDASDLVRRVEAGEVIEVTVSGRLAARIVPAEPKQWLGWSEVAECFDGRADPGWDQDRNLVDQELRNPWDDHSDVASR